jgi:hypothetical protein
MPLPLRQREPLDSDRRHLLAPTGWQATLSPKGEIELRVAVANWQRSLFTGVAWTLAVGGMALVGFGTVTGTPAVSSAPGMVLAVLLLVGAIWCTWADETWHVATNRFEHRVGIGTWSRRQIFQDAQWQVVRRFTGLNPTSLPYWRLYVVSDGSRHLVAERGEAALNELQTFLMRWTGWSALEPDLQRRLPRPTF